MQYKDFPRCMKDAMTYLDLRRETVEKAFNVARELDLFIERNFEATYPLANVTASAGTLEVAIGEVCVWCSETDDSDELTTEYCLSAYKEYVYGLAEVFK